MNLPLSSKTTLFVVLNVRSGSRDATLERKAIAEVFEAAGQPHEFMLVEEPSRLPQVAARAAAAAEQQGGAVVAAGGDGTINTVVQAVLPKRRPFGIIPQGTFNYSCRAHGIPLETKAAAAALLSPTLKPVQVGLLNGRVFLVNASLGLYPELLEEREQFKQRLGRRRIVAVLAAASTFLREHRQLVIRLVHDGKSETVVTPSLFVGNNALQLEQAGLPEAEALERRRLAAVVLAPVKAPTLFRLAITGALGKLHSAAEVRSFELKTMSVEPGRGFGKKRLKVATDGEIAWMQAPLEFKVAPQPLFLMVPASPADAT